MKNKRWLAVIIAIIIVCAIDAGIVFYLFNEFDHLKGTDYYLTFIISFVVIFFVSGVIIAFCLFPKDTQSRKVKIIVSTAVICAVATGALIPLVISRDPMRDPEYAAMVHEEEVRRQRHIEARAYAVDKWNSTSPSNSGDKGYVISGAFSVVQWGPDDNSATFYPFCVYENDPSYKDWTLYPDEAGSIIFLEYVPATVRVVTSRRETSDAIHEQYYTAKGYKVYVHVLNTDDNIRYESYYLAEALGRAVDEDVFEALKEFLDSKCTFE